MFNKVILVGNLTRNLELRYTNTGSAIGNTAIAVTRKYTANDGSKKEETCFIDITFFGKMAEIANQYLTKGSKLLVEGRLKLDQWQDNNGNSRSKHSIVVENMEMLGSNQTSTSNDSYSPQATNYNQGYSNKNANQNTYANSRQPSNYSPKEESIPEIDIDNVDDSYNRKNSYNQNNNSYKEEQKNQKLQDSKHQSKLQDLPEVDVNDYDGGDDELPF